MKGEAGAIAKPVAGGKPQYAETALDLWAVWPHPRQTMGKHDKTPADEREAKLAAALRANLRRRKAAPKPAPEPASKADDSDKRS